VDEALLAGEETGRLRYIRLSDHEVGANLRQEDQMARDDVWNGMEGILQVKGKELRLKQHGLDEEQEEIPTSRWPLVLWEERN
jgi:hypothetical protein